MKAPIVRFAPSPTGFLHIGGARTALYNWLFARHHKGTYLLRIEDTDKARSSDAAIDAIKSGLDWMGLGSDKPIVYQSHNLLRHQTIARELLDNGKAYRCYCTKDELAAMREKAKAEGRSIGYDGTWRDQPASNADMSYDMSYTVRLRSDQDGRTRWRDLVMGDIEIENTQLDDFVLLRADGTPTYMMSVVVDDHDMGITHILRGSDHLTNAARQAQLFQACGWDIPQFGHIPLIHGADGAKLSKRHGALGVEAYREMGYLPEALNNYLLRLGWSHGDEEIIEQSRAIAWFDLDAVGKSPSRFDIKKLDNLNAHYLRSSDDERLAKLILNSNDNSKLPMIIDALPELKLRAKTLIDLSDACQIYLERPQMPEVDTKAGKLLANFDRAILGELINAYGAADIDWQIPVLEEITTKIAANHDVGLGKVAQPMRVILTGRTASPSIFEVMRVLGQAQTCQRMQSVMQGS